MKKNMMMKCFSVLCAAIMLFTAAFAAAETAPQQEAVSRFEGDWAFGGGLAQIVCEEEGCRVFVEIDNQEGAGSEWEYSCYYHEDTDSLVSVASRRTDYTVNPETGDKEYAECAYEDFDDENTATEFAIDEKGFLIWKDGRENGGADLEFMNIGGFDGLWKNEAEETEVEFLWNGLDQESFFYTVYLTRGKTDGDRYASWLMTGEYDPETGKLTASGTCTLFTKNAAGGYDTEDDGETVEAVFSRTADGKVLYEADNGIELEFDIMGHQ